MRTQTPCVRFFGVTTLFFSFAAWGCERTRSPITPEAPAPNSQATLLSPVEVKAKELILKDFPVLGVKGMGPLQPITDDAVKRAFPGFYFFVYGFTVYPAQQKIASGFDTRNVFIVSKDSKLQHHKADCLDPPNPYLKSLEQFFRENLGLVKDDEAAKQAVEAWLRLSEEFTQDEYFHFLITRDSLLVQTLKDGRKASGKAIVTEGGKGEIRATLHFTAEGKLSEIAETNTVRRGVRPKCQATKLLDPDPIVRLMAEQDILVMGRAAKPYLDEERAKVSSELREAIDRIWQRIVDEGW
jgi:hypothetical protein